MVLTSISLDGSGTVNSNSPVGGTSGGFCCCDGSALGACCVGPAATVAGSSIAPFTVYSRNKRTTIKLNRAITLFRIRKFGYIFE